MYYGFRDMRNGRGFAVGKKDKGVAVDKTASTDDNGIALNNNASSDKPATNDPATAV